MEDGEWAQAMSALATAAEFTVILSRCLDVQSQLTEWRSTSADYPGGDAANALDQAAGMLERLINGEAAALLAQVQAVLDELPPAWD